MSSRVLSKLRTFAISAAFAASSTLAAFPASAGGVEPTRLSLPQGPASIEGLGRAFASSMASGTGSHGIAIAVPPAVGGFVPALSFDYDAGAGVSELGLGWKLGGVPSIRRRVEHGLPRFDETDSFELVGLGMPSDLLEQADGYFRPEHETGSFVRVQRGQDGTRWEARSKGGITYRFGGDGFTEHESQRVVTYLLREQVDLHGHAIRYEWDTSEGRALLLSVTWNDFSEAVRNSITLTYETRPDVHELFSAGVRQTLTRRLKTAEVTVGGQLVRRYTLGYGAGAHSLLESVELLGSDGTTRFPKESYEYTRANFNTTNIISMKSAPGRSPGADTQIVDLNGDGLPDLLVGVAGRFRSYVNRDGLSWEEARDWQASDSPSVSLSSSGVQIADLDADGAVDLVIKSGNAFRYLPAKDALHFGAAVPVARVPNFTFEDANVRLADLDGDRRTDVLVTTAVGIAIAYNLNGKDWTEPTTVGKVDEKQQLLFADKKTQLCDVNGDRIQDFCYLRSGSLSYWLGRGRGEFMPARKAKGVPTFDDSDPWHLIDLNNDGWTDLVHVGIQNVSFALATAAGTFAQPQTIEGTPTRKPSTVVEFADMNGSGTIDVVWIDTTGTAEHAWRYWDLFSDGRGGLLRRIDNGFGKITTIDYEPAALTAARAREAGEPWTSRINVAMPVIRRVSVDASLGDKRQVTEYDYRDGTWDPNERTFAGFAAGTQYDLGDEYTPTRVTKNTYDPGVEVRVMRGALLEQQTSDMEGRVFERAEKSYTVRNIAQSRDGRSVQYAYVSAERIEQIEGTSGTPRWTLTEWEQDGLGNTTKVSEWGEVRGEDKLFGQDERISIYTHANNLEDWIIGNVATVEVQDASGKRISLKRNYYDGSPFVGLPLGQIERGNLTRGESWIEANQFADDARMEFDAHGNPITVLTARGERSEFEFDPESYTYVIKETRFASEGRSLAWQSEYDRRFGRITEVTGPNGERHSYRYDALGYITHLVRPGDTLEKPTEHYSYELGSPQSQITLERREVSGADGVITSVSLIDGLGRSRGSFQEAGDRQWSLSGVVQFDARGNVAFSAFPTFETSLALPMNESRDGVWSRRDALGRELETENLDGSKSRVAYLPFARKVWDENDNAPTSKHYDTPTTYERDGLGRLRVVTEREGKSEIVTGVWLYDAADKPIEVRDANGSTRKYQYDGRSRLRVIDDPNAKHFELTYTDGNDLERRLDPTGRSVRYVYDVLGRVVEEWHQLPGATEAREKRYHYDSPSPEHPMLGNVLGQLAWVEDAAGKVFLGYDARGREIERIRQWTNGKEHRTWAEYDAADREVLHGYPDGSYLRTSYNERGLLSSVGPIASEFKWRASGQLESVRFGNGVVDRREYDRRLRVERLVASVPGGAPIRDIRYTFDPASRIVAITDLRPGIPKEQSVTATYGFDDRYRLRSATDSIGTTSWQYDDVGKVKSITSDHATAALNITNTYGENGAGADQLTHHGGEVWTYDGAGRLISDGSRALNWDAKGRLARVTRGDIVEEYVYGFDDTRLVKVTKKGGTTETVRYISEDAEERNGKLIRYVFIGGERIARLDAETDRATGAASLPVTLQGRPFSVSSLQLFAVLFAAITLFAWAFAETLGRHAADLRRACAAFATLLVCSSLLAAGCGDGADGKPPGIEITSVPESSVFYVADLQGSPLAIADARAKVASTTSYHPYGGIRSSQETQRNRFKFLGNEHDDGADLGDFNARPYRASAGVFLAPDPVAVFTPERVVGEPERLYAYAYAGADPINRSDPSGEIFETLWDAANVAMGVVSAVRNVATGQYGAAAVDAGGVVLDVVATVVPGVPGGAGTAIKAARAADHTVDAVRAAKAADHVVDAGRAAEKAAEAAKAAEKAADAARAAEKAADAAKAAQAAKAAEKAKAVTASKGAKRGPKTDLNAPHNAKIRSEAEKLKAEGNRIVSGGGGKERVVQTPGGKKASRRPDIEYTTPDGTVRGRNVGRTKADGTPVKREVEALEDLNGPGNLPTDFVPYDR